jgi:hypothetical protein
MINAQHSSVKDNIDSVKVNFMYSYYEQDGVHSPVTGGIGDEELYDHGRRISVSVPLRNNINLSVLSGIDVYTSASTDNINDEHDLLLTETSASYKDERKYSSIGLEKKNKQGYIISSNAGFSKEWDVNSINYGISLTHLSKNENTQIRLSTSYYKDKWDLIYPYELRPFISDTLEDIKRSFNASLMFSQVINKRLKMALSIETVSQNGLLSTPFHRVYFNDTTHTIERLPNKRFKIPVAMYSSYYMNDRSILRFYYRFYTDDFDINAHTVQIETPIKISPSIVISPFYRIHTQEEAKYFEPFAIHNPNAEYYTSDYDLSGFNSHKLGFGIKYSPLFGFFNKINSQNNQTKIKFKKLEIRTSKYFRINKDGVILKAYIATFGVSYVIN